MVPRSPTLAPLTVLASVLLLPYIASAQSFDYLDFFVESVGALVQIVVPVLIALALALFLWGLVVFIFQAENDTARAAGRQRMVWGVIILFVAVSIWGIIALLYQISGVEKNPTINAPDTNFITSGGGFGGGGTGAGGGGGSGPGGVPAPPPSNFGPSGNSMGPGANYGPGTAPPPPGGVPNI
jgi:hypothetical protein